MFYSDTVTVQFNLTSFSNSSQLKDAFKNPEIYYQDRAGNNIEVYGIEDGILLLFILVKFSVIMQASHLLASEGHRRNTRMLLVIVGAENVYAFISCFTQLLYF